MTAFLIGLIILKESTSIHGLNRLKGHNIKAKEVMLIVYKMVKKKRTKLLPAALYVPSRWICYNIPNQIVSVIIAYPFLEGNELAVFYCLQTQGKVFL